MVQEGESRSPFIKVAASIAPHPIPLWHPNETAYEKSRAHEVEENGATHVVQRRANRRNALTFQSQNAKNA